MRLGGREARGRCKRHDDNNDTARLFSAVLTLFHFIISGHDTQRRLRRTIRGDKLATRTDPSEAVQVNFEVAAAQGGRRSDITTGVGRETMSREQRTSVAPADVFRQMSQAKATAGVSSSADKFMRAVRAHLHNLPAELSPDDMAFTNFEEYIWQIMTDLANRLIPIHHRDDLTSPNPES